VPKKLMMYAAGFFAGAHQAEDSAGPAGGRFEMARWADAKGART